MSPYKYKRQVIYTTMNPLTPRTDHWAYPSFPTQGLKRSAPTIPCFDGLRFLLCCAGKSGLIARIGLLLLSHFRNRGRWQTQGDVSYATDYLAQPWTQIHFINHSHLL